MTEPSIPAVFTRDGDRFIPSASAPGPWNREHLHGGPSCGLLARELARIAGGPSLTASRLTLDLMRPVPMRPLTVKSALVRDGKRIRLAQASIFDGELEVARATGLFLERGTMPAMEAWPSPSMHGPEGIETTSLFRDRAPNRVPRGFHTVVEARWASAPDALGQAGWFRMPMPLVEGEPDSGLVRAAALGDFANAVASLSIRRLNAPPFINVDTTLYLVREPEGEWIGMAADYCGAEDGVGLVEVIHYDHKGRYGRSVQARLVMSAPPGASAKTK